MISIYSVITGVLVNAVNVTSGRLVSAISKSRRSNDLDLARYFDTESISSEPPNFESPAQLTEILRSDEFQAALQELLAVRLTDAAEQYALQAREVLIRTLTPAGTDIAELLTNYYDDQIGGLVARLEGADSALLAQIRHEALAARMINILHAIERHIDALSSRPSEQAENRFLASYRRHVKEHHGKLEPPDFERRRYVPIKDIYVPCEIFDYFLDEQFSDSQQLNVYDLATVVDRTVLLGDPGGGKTTAANVLMHRFASSGKLRVPFIVTLRDFAAKDPPERSVVKHIEHTLATLYQCSAPSGLVDLFLLTGRAVVIFDGLDELIDTSRRRDVTDRVEQFCVEYPQAAVLVTSRLIGYDQARLDDRQFTCYRLGGFNEGQIVTYVEKWFGLAAGSQPDEAQSFLRESANLRDLRSNPLLLSLLCILYRGRGTLPQDRDEIYAKCTDLLIRDWDDFRRIRHELRVGRAVRPLLKHLSYWLFTHHDGAAVVSKRELIATAADFLLRNFESWDEARDAAKEFVEFCSNRMWILADRGTTAAGEVLYGFTHRTFLEYFAAAHMAIENDSPEQLAIALAPYMEKGEWPVVAELAVQIKDRSSRSGAERIYGTLLDYDVRQLTQGRARMLTFLALCLRSVDPTPARVRHLARCVISECVAVEKISSTLFHEDQDLRSVAIDLKELQSAWQVAVSTLLHGCGSYRNTVADEIGAMVPGFCSDGYTAIVHGVRIVASLGYFLGDDENGVKREFWYERSAALLRANSEVTAQAAESSAYIRAIALRKKIITMRQALAMPGGPSSLMRNSTSYFDQPTLPPVLEQCFQQVANGWPAWSDDATLDDLAALGEYLTLHPEAPWFRVGVHLRKKSEDETQAASDEGAMQPADLDPHQYLGAAAVMAAIAESRRLIFERPEDLGPIWEFSTYLHRRHEIQVWVTLPELPVPIQFRRILRDWANGKFDVVMPRRPGIGLH